MDNLGETTYYRYDSRDNLVATADADGPRRPDHHAPGLHRRRR